MENMPSSPSGKTALICGVSGQDGAYLARLLLAKGYIVWGTSREPQGSDFSKLHTLGIADQVHKISMLPEDSRSVFLAVSKTNPDEIYYLSGMSSVGLSFDQPAETIRGVVLGTLNILEACRVLGRAVRLFNAGSSECFGDTEGQAANESTPFSPRSPYAVAKSSAYWLVRNYREAYKLYACTGILFNHESPLRPDQFVTKKIVAAAKNIAAGSSEKLKLGRMDIARDWGWAPEYVEAMWLMLQQDQPQDFVIATGETHSLEDFVQLAFSAVGLNWHDHVRQDETLFRPTDVAISVADPSRARTQLGWSAQTLLPQVVKKMMV